MSGTKPVILYLQYQTCYIQGPTPEPAMSYPVNNCTMSVKTTVLIFCLTLRIGSIISWAGIRIHTTAPST